MIKLFFEKAVSEPCFAPTYTIMCQALSKKAVLSSTDAEKACLFALCNSPIAKKNLKGTVLASTKKNEIHSAETEDRKKELTKELQDLVDQHRRRVLGNITFIGELFGVGTISEEARHRCILHLLTN